MYNIKYVTYAMDIDPSIAMTSLVDQCLFWGVGANPYWRAERATQWSIFRVASYVEVSRNLHICDMYMSIAMYTGHRMT